MTAQGFIYPKRPKYLVDNLSRRDLYGPDPGLLPWENQDPGVSGRSGDDFPNTDFYSRMRWPAGPIFCRLGLPWRDLDPILWIREPRVDY
jgi:hypothetical protein